MLDTEFGHSGHGDGGFGHGVTAGTDFGTVADFTITIAAHSVSHTGTFNLTPIPDSVDEPDETVAVARHDNRQVS